MSTIVVTTAKGRLVKDPRGRAVPEKFAVDPADPFWSRLLAASDLVAVDPPAVPPKPAIAAPASPVAKETTP